VSIETIRASSDRELSTEISKVFAEQIMRHEDNLHLLTFRVLRNRALRGDRLLPTGRSALCRGKKEK
jgi:hypothetical protein